MPIKSDANLEPPKVRAHPNAPVRAALAVDGHTTDVLGFRPVKTKRIFEVICESIRDQVVANKLSAGDRLPSERELSELFQVSRPAVREALRSLEIAGIVVRKKGSKGGAFITKSGVGQVTRSFSDMLDFGQTSLSALLEARMLVLDVVVRTACERADAMAVDALRQNLAETVRLTEEGRHEERTMKAVEFNIILANATCNPVLSAIVEAMASVIRAFVVASGPPVHDPIISSRRRIIEQIAARDAEGACETMRSYLGELTIHLLRTEHETKIAGARATANRTKKRAVRPKPAA